MQKIAYAVYRLIRWVIWLFYPKIEVVGAENLPDAPAIIVGNHSQMNGPIVSQLYFPGKKRIWCAAEMMRMREVPGYAYRDFWSCKPRWQRPIYRLLSYIIAPLCACVFNHADTIGVYHDSRIVSTFKSTVRQLQEGSHIIIFPEHYAPHNQILCDFRRNFVDVARLYFRRTGQAPDFVPMYIAPRLRKLFIGKPIPYDPQADPRAEQERIAAELMASITRLAEAQPEHTVVPYPNIPRKHYTTNHSSEVIPFEQTDG